jgi:hypothetical protein
LGGINDVLAEFGLLRGGVGQGRSSAWLEFSFCPGCPSFEENSRGAGISHHIPTRCSGSLLVGFKQKINGRRQQRHPAGERFTGDQ